MMSRRLFLFILALLVSAPLAQFFIPTAVHAAANIGVGTLGSVTVGDTVSVNITVNTGGQSANAFQGNFTYPAGLFDPVRGTFSGSICTLPIQQPDPSGGAASFSCGRPSGFSGSGTVAVIVLKAIASGSGSFGMSGCQVLANDGQGTDITGGCSGSGFTIKDAATPPPQTPTPDTQQSTPTPSQAAAPVKSATPTPTPKPTPTPTPTPSKAPTPTPTPTQIPVAAETPAAPVSTVAPTAPPVQSLAPTKEPAGISTPQPSDAGTTSSQPRTIAQAIQAILASSKDLKSLHSSPAGVIALMVTTIPFLALCLAILFLGYRLYMIERKRRNTLDRLFEMELSELAALEGKMDLLAEKGTKGRDQYREEFKHAKENILRELKPSYGKSLDPEQKPAAIPDQK